MPNFVPKTKILDVPFLFCDGARPCRARRPHRPSLAERFDAKGFKALAWAENGFRHMSNSKRDVKGPEDLKGLKMRTMENPVHIAAYKALASSPRQWRFLRFLRPCGRAGNGGILTLTEASAVAVFYALVVGVVI